MKLALEVAGAGLLVLALAHAFFGRIFRYADELPRLSLLNRQVFLVHSFFIALTVGLMGALSLFGAELLLGGTTLARWVNGGMAGFWFCRLVAQLFVYSPAIWKGNRFYTVMHGVFTAAWLYLTVVYALAMAA